MFGYGGPEEDSTFKKCKGVFGGVTMTLDLGFVGRANTIESSQRRQTPKSKGQIRSTPLRWVILAAAALLVFRIVYVQRHVPVHSDEIHYAADGLWLKSSLSTSEKLVTFFYHHVHPHPYVHPGTNRLVFHGDNNAKFKGRLASHPRAGHPPLYMTVLAAVYSPWSLDYLKSKQRFVRIARSVSAIFDLAWFILLFDILRRRTSARLAYSIFLLLAIMPFFWVFGTLAYLDPIATFFAVLAAWVLVVKIGCDAQPIYWALLGAAVGLGIAAKQSNVVVFPILVGLFWIFDLYVVRRKLAEGIVVALGVSLLSVSVFTDPVALKAEIQQPTDPAMRININTARMVRQLCFPFQPSKHYRFGRERHHGRPIVKADWIVDCYEITTPLFFGGVWLSVFVLLLKRRWRALLLVTVIIAFSILIPLGTVIRRLYVLFPFMALVIATAFERETDWQEYRPEQDRHDEVARAR